MRCHDEPHTYINVDRGGTHASDTVHGILIAVHSLSNK